MDEAALKTIERKVKGQTAQAVAFAEASSFPDRATIYHYVYKQTDYSFLQH